jgi:hypothetical protein
MTGRVQTLRSSTAGNRPAVGSQQPGSLYTNWPDKALGVIDSTQTPMDLIAVRFFSTLASYAAGQFVLNGGQLYAANTAVAPGAFNPAQWTKVALAGDPVSNVAITGGTINNTVIGGTTPAAATVTSLNGGQLAGTRNRLINGDFRIDQRTGGNGIVASAGAQYFCDHWGFATSQGGHASLYGKQVAAGLGYYGQAVMTSAFTTPGASDYQHIYQAVEGQNIVDLYWGTTLAKPVTISGVIYNSVTGNAAISLRNGAANLCYVTTVPITVANQWTYFNFTVPGPTSGTWTMDNSTGLYLTFSLGAGATFTSPAPNTWASGNYVTVAGAIDNRSSASANFAFRDIQLEPGSTPTPFERRLAGLELELCQRYYQRFTTASANYIVYSGSSASAGGVSYVMQPISPGMRAVPTLTQIGTWSNLYNITSLSMNATAANMLMIQPTTTAAGFWYAANPANGGFDLSAEL